VHRFARSLRATSSSSRRKCDTKQVLKGHKKLGATGQKNLTPPPLPGLSGTGNMCTDFFPRKRVMIHMLWTAAAHLLCAYCNLGEGGVIGWGWKTQLGHAYWYLECYVGILNNKSYIKVASCDEAVGKFWGIVLSLCLFTGLSFRFGMQLVSLRILSSHTTSSTTGDVCLHHVQASLHVCRPAGLTICDHYHKQLSVQRI
jgi:hypothetical protein